MAKTLPIKLMVAFGSYFANNFGWGSDVDILVVVESTKDNLEDIHKVLLVAWSPTPLDIFLYTLDEYHLMRSTSHPLLSRALQDGVILIQNGD